jgi:hypothetical protein
LFNFNNEVYSEETDIAAIWNKLIYGVNPIDIITNPDGSLTVTKTSGVEITYTPPSSDKPAELIFKSGERVFEIEPIVSVNFKDSGNGEYVQTGSINIAKRYLINVKDVAGNIVEALKLNDPEDVNTMNESRSIGQPFKIDMNFSDNFETFMTDALKDLSPVYFNRATMDPFVKYSWVAYNSTAGERFDFLQYLATYSQSDKVLYGVRGYAYNNFDAGNFLWGMAMHFLDLDYWEVKMGSELNGFFLGKKQNGETTWYDFITLDGDSIEDQKAIKRGYEYFR